MRKKTLLVLLTIFTLCFGSLMAQEKGDNAKTKDTDTAKSFQINAGLQFSYNDAKIKTGEGDNEIDNSMRYYYFGLGVDVEVADFLTVGILAGLNTNYFGDPITMINLPLSLSFDQEKNNSMVFGLNAKTQFNLPGYWQVQVYGQYLYFKEFSNETDINLPITTGTATMKTSFSQLTLEMLAVYDGFSSFTLFAGPQLNTISGDFKVEEQIGTLTGNEELSFQQKNTFGLTAGVQFDLGSHFEVEARLSFLSRNSISASVNYVF